MGKKWYQSRTIWVGVLTFLGGLATAVAGEVASGGALTVVGLLNVILRTVTDEPIQ